MRQLQLFALLFVLLACSTEAQQPAAQRDAASLAPQDVAARVGDRTITAKELDEHWRQTDAAQQAQAMQALYDGRRAALDDIVATMLLEQAAKAKNVSVAQYLDAEIAGRAKPVSDTDVAVFYGENRGQMQGRSLEEMSPLIRRYLEDQRRQSARSELIASLKKTGPAVRVMFDAPRQQVTLAGDEPAIGPATAPVTIVEFSDFQCPFCQRVAPTLKQLKAKYGDQIRIVWKDFPLTQIHPQAFDAAQAANCAREQGKFWEYHDQLFANQAALQPDSLKRYATAVGMNANTFGSCLDSKKYEQKVRAAIDYGSQLGIGSTPTLFINGRMIAGAQPYETFAAVIDEELQRR